MIKHGKIRADIFTNLLNNEIQNITIDAGIPLPEIAPIFSKGGILDFLTGNIGEGKFSDLMQETILNPIVLARCVQSTDNILSQSANEISNLFWMQCDKIQAAYDKMIEKIFSIEYKNIDLDLLIEFISERINSHEFHIPIIESISNTVPDANYRNCKGSFNFANVCSNIIFNKVRSSFQHRDHSIDFKAARLKRGDYGDMSHSIYQPYVDIFCCDKRTANFLLNIRTLKNNLCTNEKDLIRLLNN